MQGVRHGPCGPWAARSILVVKNPLGWCKSWIILVRVQTTDTKGLMVAAVLRCSASAGMLVVRVFHGLGAGGQGCFQSGEQREEVVLQSTRVHQVLISSSNPPNQFSLFRHVKYSTGVGQRRPNDYQEA